jgi:hypothetical protein
MGLVTANIQPIEFDEACSAPSAFGMQAIAAIEVDGFEHPEIDRGPRRADPPPSSSVAIKRAVRVHAERMGKVAG